ncbi:sigma-70 family RNA polymerase sigma factor [Paenibacillus sp.]|jgi:RNA polymerase sigma-70 factor (ECF subfamily)|uniref:sigma-70 family RNA polymerase sigma factor n=1 Tax=Paenibacillus sp. TaxID=58172 RepID=UPI002822A748|nr:sigma-70 family RNA polymerase sigma factor [Paenibacillus sp.]MDR0270739.1 sigma-70 family RNA polymerase sigma factor [Paenibacillus sp.]
MQTDPELSAAACQGDEEAFYTLVSGMKRKLFGIAYSYLGSETDALEAVQEAICRAWMKCGKLKDPAAFHAWLIRILIHCCIDEQKRRKRTLPLKNDTQDNRMAVMVSDSRLDLQQAMQRLKPKYRHVLMLKYYQDMTLTEIARVLGKPEGTVKTWLHQGLKQLRGKMDAGGELYHG